MSLAVTHDPFPKDASASTHCGGAIARWAGSSLCQALLVSPGIPKHDLTQDELRAAVWQAMTRQILALANEVMAAKERAGSSSTGVPSQSTKASQQARCCLPDSLQS